MKRLFLILFLINNLLYTTTTQCKLYWETEDTWRSYYPYVSFINKTNYDLEIGIGTNSSSEINWQPLAINQTLPIVIAPDFKELRIKLSTETNHLTPIQEEFYYDFTKEIMPNLKNTQDHLEENPHAAFTITVVVKESRPLVPILKAPACIKVRMPILNVIVHAQLATSNRLANYVAAKKINKSLK